jgi:hypothetical protein
MGKGERLQQPVAAMRQRAQEAACRLLVAAACARRERRLGSCDVEEVVLMLRAGDDGGISFGWSPLVSWGIADVHIHDTVPVELL